MRRFSLRLALGLQECFITPVLTFDLRAGCLRRENSSLYSGLMRMKNVKSEVEFSLPLQRIPSFLVPDIFSFFLFLPDV